MYESGRSDEFINTFYNLMLITRRRHQLPPQPIELVQATWPCTWAKACRCAWPGKTAQAIAAMLTLRHGANIIYKYGCSDGAFHQLGGMPFLFWKLIEEGKATGAECHRFRALGNG